MSARLRDADFAPLWFTVWWARVLEYWRSQYRSNALVKEGIKRKTRVWGLGKSTTVNPMPGNTEVLCGNQSAVHSWLNFGNRRLNMIVVHGATPLLCEQMQFLTSCLHSQETILDWFCNLSFGGTSCISFWKPTFLPPSWWCYPGFRFGSLSILFLRELALVRSSPGRVLRTRWIKGFWKFYLYVHWCLLSHCKSWYLDKFFYTERKMGAEMERKIASEGLYFF